MKWEERNHHRKGEKQRSVLMNRTEIKETKIKLCYAWVQQKKCGAS